MKLQLLRELNSARAARRAVALISRLDDCSQRIVQQIDFERDPLGAVLTERLRTGRSGIEQVDGLELYVQVFRPPSRLIVIGAVHITQALIPIARAIGIDVTVIDPRTAFATPERFPDVDLRAEWPEDVLPILGLDDFSAVALLTHDPKIDDPALIAALKAKCFYIGALGSKKTHGRRLERMGSAGFGNDELRVIHAPIGLDIGAVSPAEIAVSIAGEIIAAQRKKPLRDERSTLLGAGQAA